MSKDSVLAELGVCHRSRKSRLWIAYSNHTEAQNALYYGSVEQRDEHQVYDKSK